MNIKDQLVFLQETNNKGVGTVEELYAIILYRCYEQALFTDEDYFAIQFNTEEMPDKHLKEFRKHMQITKERFEEQGIHVTKLNDGNYMIDWRN